jgi:hypothetical protein
LSGVPTRAAVSIWPSTHGPAFGEAALLRQTQARAVDGQIETAARVGTPLKPQRPTATG